MHPDTLLRWLQKQVALYDSVQIRDMGASFKNGLAICAIIHRYRPNLIDFHNLKPDDPVTNNQLAFDILEKELGIPPVSVVLNNITIVIIIFIEKNNWSGRIFR